MYTLTDTLHLHFSLGCPAVIPCKKGDPDLFKWFHKNIQIFVQGKGGAPRFDNHFLNKINVAPNGSLVIKSFTEDHQGLYQCDICHEDSCKDKMSTVIRVDKGQNYCYSHD